VLTSPKGDQTEPEDKGKVAIGLVAAISGLVVTTVVLVKHVFLYANPNATLTGDHEINMKVIGNALMGTGKYQYLLPFEVLSVLLLAAIIGGIIIAKKR
jgi:NADH-quinone oxidoreductase subunit J